MGGSSSKSRDELATKLQPHIESVLSGQITIEDFKQEIDKIKIGPYLKDHTGMDYVYNYLEFLYNDFKNKGKLKEFYEIIDIYMTKGIRPKYDTPSLLVKDRKKNLLEKLMSDPRFQMPTPYGTYNTNALNVLYPKFFRWAKEKQMFKEQNENYIKVEPEYKQLFNECCDKMGLNECLTNDKKLEILKSAAEKIHQRPDIQNARKKAIKMGPNNGGESERRNFPEFGGAKTRRHNKSGGQIRRSRKLRR